MPVEQAEIWRAGTGQPKGNEPEERRPNCQGNSGLNANEPVSSAADLMLLR